MREEMIDLKLNGVMRNEGEVTIMIEIRKDFDKFIQNKTTLRNMEEATEMWMDFWMVKSFQHERKGIERLKNRREAGKRSKKCGKDRGYVMNGGW